MMRMIVTTIINISIVLYGTLWPYETGTITFHFTVEETEVQQVKKICPRSQGCYGELGFPPQQCGLLLPTLPSFCICIHKYTEAWYRPEMFIFSEIQHITKIFWEF